jgi:hypothetical protein
MLPRGFMFSWLKRKRTAPTKGADSDNVRDSSWSRCGAGKALCRWTHPDGKHRVYLFALNDGLFCYVTEYLFACGTDLLADDQSRHCWVYGGTGDSLYHSEATATREILLALPWVQDTQREEPPSETNQAA